MNSINVIDSAKITKNIIIIACLGIFIGITASFLKGIIILLVLGIIGLLFTITLVVRSNKSNIDQLVFPLIVTSILLPPISINDNIPYLRIELIIIFLYWLIFFSNPHFRVYLNFKYNSSLYRWFLFFALSICLSIIYAAFFLGYYPITRDLFEFLKLLEFFLIFILISNLKISAGKIKKIYIISLFLFLISSLFGFMQYFNFYNINYRVSTYYTKSTPQINGLIHGSRIIGTTGNPNEFAALMVLAAFLALAGYVFLCERKIRIFSIISFIIFSITIILTLSRTGLIILIVGSIYILFIKCTLYYGIKNTFKRNIILFPLIIALIFFVMRYAPKDFFTRIDSGMNLNSDNSWQVRQIAWNFALDAFKKSPIFGWGPGKDSMTTIVDNEWLLLLRRYGIFGVSIFVLWFLNFYWRLKEIFHINNDFYIKTFSTCLQATILAYSIYMFPAAIYHSLQLMAVFILYLAVIFSQGELERRLF